ncbi:BON domain-containing protein [Nostoc sp. 106C]|uniref:BON domain-containing protein n=1 Tax=Nostoc sp. 106C TaxID=1932667 RepID=UPI000A3B9329|nr:BON domain-containing protein [Nostoc sp. 106C]OUL19873.1 phospholipid-binding protein [Nostoc sp. RF31YmG]OUL30936.1 phospholipid-binding protein [Nostoc sp. 106C]
MKKLIPLLVTGILVVGTFGCQDATKTSSDTSTTNESSQPAKEASQKTATGAKTTTETGKTAVKETGDKTKTAVKEAAANTKTAAKGVAESTSKSLILSKLSEKIPGSKLIVEDKDGAVTVKGTVPTEADLKKIAPLVKEQKGVKSVKVEAKAASAKAQ